MRITGRIIAFWQSIQNSIQVQLFARIWIKHEIQTLVYYTYTLFTIEVAW